MYREKPPLTDMASAIRAILETSEQAMLDARDRNDKDLQAFLAGEAGWQIPRLLTYAAAVALAQGLSSDDENVAMIREGLIAFGFSDTIQAPRPGV
jgi:hypothetical protein